LSAGYYEAYYLKAQKVRTLVKEDFQKAFEKVDVIMSPVSPALPFKIGEKSEDPLSMYLVDIYTVSINLAGLPAISLPVGKVGNLPVGLQIIAPVFQEDRIFKTANLYEF
jgi:aspartyl-tRNA(Asn)/glutamyl-tRNA(Gln) amidotransferase subunit A